MQILYAASAILLLTAAFLLLFPIVWFGGFGSWRVLVDFSLAIALLLGVFLGPKAALNPRQSARNLYVLIGLCAGFEVVRLLSHGHDAFVLGLPDAIVITAILVSGIRAYICVKRHPTASESSD